MNLFAKLVTLYLLTTAINAQSLLGVTLYETKGERHIALEEFDFTTGKGTPYVQLDKDDGWTYSSASVVDEATNTIYLCLSDTLETGHLYAVKDGKVLLGLHGTKPYEGLDFANGTLYGYFNNQSTQSAEIHVMDPATFKVKSTLAVMPKGWLLLSTHGFTHDSDQNIFYLWCANFLNATIDYSSIFGVDGNSGKIVSTGQVKYGNKVPEIRFSLYYDNKNKDVIAITEDTDLTKPGYYLSVIDPKTGKFVKEIGTERVYADLPAGADAYPMINGFSSVDRQYFVEFEITYKDDKSKNHPDMVAIDIDTGAMVSQAKNVTADYVDMVYLSKTQTRQSELERIFENIR